MGSRPVPILYDPITHRLTRRDAKQMDARHFGEVNRPIVETAALAIVLVGHLPAIRPLYGDWWREQSAGPAYLAKTAHPGAYPSASEAAPSVAWTSGLRESLGIGVPETDVFLHALLAGPIDAGGNRLAAGAAGRGARRRCHDSAGLARGRGCRTTWCRRRMSSSRRCR